MAKISRAFALLSLIFMSFLLLGSAFAGDEVSASDVLVFKVIERGEGIVEDGLRFVVLDLSGPVEYVETRDGMLNVSRRAGYRLIGPLIDDEGAYLPVNIYLTEHFEGEAIIILERAVKVRLVELYPWIDGRPLEARYRLELVNSSLGYPRVLYWSHGEDLFKRALGLRDGEILVPVSPGYRLFVEFEAAGDGGFSWSSEMTEAVKGGEIVSLLRAIYPKALETVNEEARRIRESLDWLAVSGVYLGYQRNRLEDAEQRIKLSGGMFEDGRIAEAYHLLRKAFIDLRGISSVLVGYETEPYSGSILVPLFLVLGALTLSHLVLNEKRVHIAAGVAFLSLIVFGFMALSFPALLPRDAWGWSALLYSVLIMLGLVWSLPSLSLEIRTQRGVALIAAASLAFSVAIRFLRTRPIRTWLMVAMATITVSSALLLVNTGVEGGVFVSSPIEKVSPIDIPHIIIYSRDYRYDNLAPVDTRYVEFLRSLGLSVGVRAETPIAPPSGRTYLINFREYNLRGVIGVEGETPIKRQLSGCLLEGSIDDIGDGPSSLLSSDLASSVGASVGSSINVNGRVLKVAGILRTDCPTYMKDVDGYFVSTLVKPPMSPVTPAGWSNIIVTGLEEAQRLGGLPTKIYVTGRGDEAIYGLAEVISLHTDLKVRVVKTSGDVFVFNLLNMAGIKGGEVLVVVGIAFLNLLVASLANYYERRGEFFTMSTLGLNPGHILLLSGAEALLLGIVASYLGVLATLSVLGVIPRLAAIPIDFKLTQESMLGVFALAIVIFVSSHLLSVRKSVILSTPAQTWKWALSKTLDEEGYWVVELPARIKASKIRHFITYMSSRLSEYSFTTTVNINVLGVEEDHEGDMCALKFIYSSTEQRAFRASCLLEVYRRGEWSSVILRLKVEAQDARFVDQYIREVAQLLRQFIIEYTSLTVRILVPLSRENAHLRPLLSVYNPSEVKLVWRGYDERDLERAVRLLEREMVRVEIVRLDPTGSIVAHAKTVIDAARDCDLICISSDDGYLSSIALLTAQRLEKRICVVKDSEVVEATPMGILEQLR